MQMCISKGIANLAGLPKDLTTEPPELTEKTSKKSLWTVCALW